MDKKKIIAIIPARSGSKGLPDKNIKCLDGKPLLAYSVEAARDAGVFDVIHVSTDSQKYSDIAKEYGADQPFLRDEINSRDNSSSWDAVREVLRKYRDMGLSFDLCVLLQPTSPLKKAEDICGALRLFDEKGASSVSSVTEVEHPIEWCFPLDETDCMSAFASSPYKNCRRQTLAKSYRENGAIYIVAVKDILNPEFEFYNPNCYAYRMAPLSSIDIDTELDFRIAEALIHDQQENR